MANTKGGHIVIGVADKPLRQVGVSDKISSEFVTVHSNWRSWR
jgi:predicted HTH transcriptional regulator